MPMIRYIFTIFLFVLFGGCAQASAPVKKTANKFIVKKSFIEPSDQFSHSTRLIFAGDTHFHWRISDLQDKNGINFPVLSLQSLFKSADYRILNLETTLTKNGIPFNKKSYIFSSDQKNVQLLKYLGVNTAILGNNHSMDMGPVGLMDTISHLRKAGINSVGAGMNKSRATSPLYFKVGNIKFGILSFSAVGEEMTFSGANRAGVAAPSLKILKRRIKAMKNYTDAIIVSLHWGTEYFVHPNQSQIDLAHKIIDLGATAIIGHHPHIPQGMEVYKDKFIAYSLGNFLFGSVNNRQNHNMVLQLNFNKESKDLTSVSIFPVYGKYRENKNEGVRQLRPIETIDFWKDMIVQCSRLSPTAQNRIRIAEDGTGEFLVR